MISHYLYMKALLYSLILCLNLGFSQNLSQAQDIPSLMSASSGSERRVALVIGNQDYAINPLHSPIHDAYAISEALQDLGFEVLSYFNLNQLSMYQAIIDFEHSLQSADVGLIYFAGYGLEINGENYLLPIDISFEQEHQIKYRAMSLSTMLNALRKGGAKLNIVLLDACRHRSFPPKHNSLGEDSGCLARIDRKKLRDFIPAPNNNQASSDPTRNQAFGYFISYAPMMATNDSSGYTPYTQRILRYIHTPNLEIEAMFWEINRDFLHDSMGQAPWNQYHIVGSFSFAPTR